MENKLSIMERVFPGRAAKREQQRLQAVQYRTAIQTLEAIPTFARDTDEGSWINLNQDADVYTEQNLTEMRSEAMKMYLGGSDSRGLIDDMKHFIIGKECNTTFIDDACQEYWDLFTADKKNNWDSRKGQCVVRTLRDGEVFCRMFTPQMTDTVVDPEAKPVPQIRFVDAPEIRDETNQHSYGIETDPNDVETPINYHRTYSKNGVNTAEIIPASQMIHHKIISDSNVKRGYSWLLGIAPYIKQYRRWLDDRVYLNHLRNLFNLIMTPNGVTAEAAAAMMPDATTQGSSSDSTNKKMPKPGTVVFQRGMDFEFKNLQLNAADTATDGRHIERMICKGTGLVEGIVTGDYSNSNYASALIAEAPMVKTIEAHQDEFDALFSEIALWVIHYGKSIGMIPANADEEHETAFTSMVHRELLDDTTAYQIQRQNRWISDRTISGKLGLDYDAEQEQIKMEDEDEDKRARERDGEPPRPGQEPIIPDQGVR